MAAAYLETPSRVWRRIEAVEGRDMPSLPSLPTFDDDDSTDHSLGNNSDILGGLGDKDELRGLASELRASGGFDASGPAHTTAAASTVRPGSSTNSTARLLNSLTGRSSLGNSNASKSGMGSLGGSGSSGRRSFGLGGVNVMRGTRGATGNGLGDMSLESFDASLVTSLPVVDTDLATETATNDGDEKSASKSSIQEESISVPEVYLPPEEEEEAALSFRDALASVQNSRDVTPKKYVEYSVDLKSEARPSPKDRFRNVAIRERKTIVTRTRTPSLSRTTPSPISSPSHSTPRSNRTINLSLSRSSNSSPVNPSPIPGAHIPLPRSATASPAIVIQNADEDLTESIFSEQEPSLGDMINGLEDSMEMDETEIHGPSIASSQGLPESHQTGSFLPSPNQSGQRSEASGIDEHEPTFSSEEGPLQHNSYDDRATSVARSPKVDAVSPAQVTSTTPTPGVPRARPRAHFALEDRSDEQTEEEEQFEQHEATDQPHAADFEDPLTPHTRRRSFLLSVINSTTRPRLKQPTPHPRRQSAFVPATPSIAESTPAATRADASEIQAPSLQAAFAGLTPRPTRRGSHPLSQAFTATGTPPSREGSLSPRPPSEVGGSPNQGGLPPWATPGPSGSPYDGASDRASVISTASSHDLTTHHRANTSFDPVLGLGAQGHGLGRFNAGKLNTYLHSLNRRLQEENEVLSERVNQQLERIKQLEGSVGSDSPGFLVTDGSRRRSSSGARRTSLAGTVLGDVEEDVNAEGWMEEKAQLEEMVEDLHGQLEKCAAEKKVVEEALEDEKAERAQDKERWKEKMGDVEKGVEEIVRDLERRLERASNERKELDADWTKKLKEAEYHLSEVEAERDAALERVDHAERALESGKDLGGDLATANQRIAVLSADLRDANTHNRELEDAIAEAKSAVTKVEKELGDEIESSAALEQELRAKDDEISGQFATLEKQAAELQQLQNELSEAVDYISQMEDDSVAAAERVESLEAELSAATSNHAEIEKVLQASRAEVDSLHDEVERANELARQLEEAVEAAEEKMIEGESEIADLKAKIMTLEREKERESSLAAREPSKSYHFLSPDQNVEELEAELDEAHKEIAKLSALLSQSPARKAVEKARETKLEMLEKENEELKERVKALRTSLPDFNTPGRPFNTTGMSPLHRQALAMSVRNPRTPGGPLKDMSWLNSSPADQSTSPYLNEISRLQKELNLANESIDDKLDKLEDVGLDIVGLTKKLADAREKITSLEDEIARLLRREERRTHRLERLRCKKCMTKVELQSPQSTSESSYLEESCSGLPSEPPTPPTKTSEALHAKLRVVNDNLASMQRRWNDEKDQLLDEKQMLQDAANRLNSELKQAREETQRVSDAGKAKDGDVQQELEHARKIISGLEADLRAERSRIRVLGTEQSRVQREKADLLSQIQRTESDMNDVKAQLMKVRKENHDLEGELRDNAIADQRARLLEARLAETASTMEQLRQERSLLAADHKDLQKRYTEASEQASRLKEEYASTQTTHENRRQQLDLRQSEVDELRQALSDQGDELRRAEAEKNRVVLEKKDVAKTISILEGDLRRVRKEAEALGRDMKLLKTDKDRLESRRKEDVSRAERAQKQAQSQIKLLNEQLQVQKERAVRLQSQIKTHICAADDHQVQEIKAKHKEECKGLIVNIRYLQAKLTREGIFRLDLSHQKHYLLVLLAQFEKSEQTIVAAIAKIGYPVPPPSLPSRKRPKLKSVALCVAFLSRAKKASDQWKECTASKAAVVSALHEVRRRRTTVAT